LPHNLGFSRPGENRSRLRSTEKQRQAQGREKVARHWTLLERTLPPLKLVGKRATLAFHESLKVQLDCLACEGGAFCSGSWPALESKCLSNRGTDQMATGMGIFHCKQVKVLKNNSFLALEGQHLREQLFLQCNKETEGTS